MSFSVNPVSTAVVRVPSNIAVFQLVKTNNLVIILIGPFGSQALNVCPHLRINFDRTGRLIEIVDNVVVYTLNTISLMKSQKKKVWSKFSKQIAAILLKKVIKNLLLPSRTKLSLVGIGFKFSLHNDRVLQVKVGYSHQIFINIPSEVNITCLSGHKLIVSSYSSYKVKALAALIRSKKVPDIYKGKGIRFEHEKVRLKTGKTIR